MHQPHKPSYTGLAGASHTFQVRAVDNAGNTGAPASFTWTIDNTAPTVALTLLTGSGGTDSVPPTFSVVTNDGATVNWTVNEAGAFEIRRSTCSSTLIVGSTLVGAGAVSTSIPSASLINGATNYVLCVFDTAGNGPTSAPFSVNEDHSTTTTLARTVGANPSAMGSLVTFEATVVNSGGNPSGVGNVSFFDNLVAIASCTTVPLIGNAAQCSISTLAVGGHSLTATYSGGSSGDAS